MFEPNLIFLTKKTSTILKNLNNEEKLIARNMFFKNHLHYWMHDVVFVHLYEHTGIKLSLIFLVMVADFIEDLNKQ